MRTTAKQYAQALAEAVSEARPADQDRILDNFAKLLRANGDLAMLAMIEKEFVDHNRLVRGMSLAQVSSARELSAGQERKIVDELNEYLGADVELRKKVDEGLVGGLLVRVDDLLIDGTIKGNLAELKNKLTK